MLIKECFIFHQIRDQLPELKAIVQYKGKLAQTYPDVYEVNACTVPHTVYHYSHVLCCNRGWKNIPFLLRFCT